MKNYIILFLAITLLSPACKSKKVAEDNEIYAYAEVMPVYPGGQDSMMRFILKNIIYPPLAVENATQGTVKIALVVEKNGSVSDVRALGKVIGDGLEEESIRVVKLMTFSPGKNNGKVVRVRMVIPIKFRLQ